MNKLSYKEIIGIAILIIIAVFIVNFGIKSNPAPQTNPTLQPKSVSAQEIYPLFICPCCGKTIDQCTCPMAQERKAFVDGLAEGRISDEEMTLAYVKRYGLDSFADEDNQRDFREKLTQEAPADRPQIAIEPSFYDLEDVSQKEGIVTTFFEIENKGESDLVINKLETSCGCTFASIVYQDNEGPKFSMSGHGINEEIQDWQVSITSGEKAQLKVYYDPDVHPDFRGTAIREIYVFSNDPIDFEKKISIELNQID